MRVVSAILAALAALSFSPAQATSPYITLQFDATGPGTAISVDCSIGDPTTGCFVTTPGIYSRTTYLTLLDWIGTTTFDDYSPGTQVGISGTLTKGSGGSILGTNFSYFYDTGKGCVGQQICLNYQHLDFTAANFQVTQLSPTPVPEPASWIMAIAGFGLLGSSWRIASRRSIATRMARSA